MVMDGELVQQLIGVGSSGGVPDWADDPFEEASYATLSGDPDRALRLLWERRREFRQWPPDPRLLDLAESTAGCWEPDPIQWPDIRWTQGAKLLHAVGSLGKSGPNLRRVTDEIFDGSLFDAHLSLLELYRALPVLRPRQPALMADLDGRTHVASDAEFGRSICDRSLVEMDSNGIRLRLVSPSCSRCKTAFQAGIKGSLVGVDDCASLVVADLRLFARVAHLRLLSQVRRRPWSINELSNALFNSLWSKAVKHAQGRLRAGHHDDVKDLFGQSVVLTRPALTTVLNGMWALGRGSESIPDRVSAYLLLVREVKSRLQRQ
jgi:hypothetical protein